MSLKAFHILFVLASVLLALGFGVWEIKAWLDVQRPLDLAMGVGSLLAGGGLGGYGGYFLEKVENGGYP